MGIRKILFNLRYFIRVLIKKLLTTVNILLFILSFLSFSIVVFDVGFDITPAAEKYIQDFVQLCLIFYGLAYLIKFLLTLRLKISFLARFLELLIVFCCCLIYFSGRITTGNSILNTTALIVQSKIFIYLFLCYIFIIEFSKNVLAIYNLKSNPYKVFIYSYLLFILCGTGFLLMPNATHEGISLIDAFFTSTSAVCVTGLTVVDTGTYFTLTGKIIILLLFQVGGIGVMTFTSFFILFSDSRFSLQNQFFLKNIVNDNQLGQVVKTLIKIMLFTFIFELMGALLIYFNLSHRVYFSSVNEKIFYSVFHSVSAFCNAGFSSQTDGLYHISTRFNYNIHLIISFLIIAGGLGFPIVFNYYKYFKFKIRNYLRHLFKHEPVHHFPRVINVNTRLVINTTCILLLFGFITFFITEYNNTLKDMSLYGKLVTSFFGSVTPRTAGFNTIDTGGMTTSFIMICMLLMWIGASPNSTGGGIKTSTFALAFLNIMAIGKGKDRVEIYRRRISEESTRNAFAVLLLSLLVIGISVFIITLAETDKPLISIIFECISAFGTVGLSLGITSTLSDTSKIVLIAAMYIGRIGTLTFFIAFLRKVKTLSYQYPSENIII